MALTDLVPRMQELLRAECDGERLRAELTPETAVFVIGVIEWATQRRYVARLGAVTAYDDVLHELRAAAAGPPGVPTEIELSPWTGVMLTETVAWAAEARNHAPDAAPREGYADALARLRTACRGHPEAAAVLAEHGSK
ncbi:hypothetical protein GCM10010470_16540 [Saccharopolyspora taberi]|uniref:Uncharacterized protein n=2 Tax=Saccharopolyspora taberi TaxID=60895 RepID=A0ABN3V9C1_9PSEU